MILETRRWGAPAPESVICVHGLTQHGTVFAGMAERLASLGHSVIAVDLRGHGESGREPPWDAGTHAQDLLETQDAEGVESAIWVGHSFGGLIAATLAARPESRARGLVLLDPGLEVPPERALRSAEIERLDWSFATVDGAANALLSSDTIMAAPREVVSAFVREDVRKGADDRFRFRFSPSAAVVAWSEMTRPAPPIARLPTLAVLPETSLIDSSAIQLRYQEALGEMLTTVTVPNGHNVLWESPAETFEAVEGFLAGLGESAAQ